MFGVFSLVEEGFEFVRDESCRFEPLRAYRANYRQSYYRLGTFMQLAPTYPCFTRCTGAPIFRTLSLR